MSEQPDTPGSNSTTDADDAFWTEIDADLFAGRKIDAIKQYRQLANVELTASKQAIDERMMHLRETREIDFDKPLAKGGYIIAAFGVFIVVLLTLYILQ